MAYAQDHNARAQRSEQRTAGITEIRDVRSGGNVEGRLQELAEQIARLSKALVIHGDRLQPLLMPPMEPPESLKDAHPRAIMSQTAERLENHIIELRNLTGVVERMTQAVDL